MMTGPLAFITAFVTSAVLSRPKADPKDQLIADLMAELVLVRACRDAARADRDQSDAQLRTVRPAYDALLHIFAEEQETRLRLERDLIESEARVMALWSNDKRSQAPRHLPVSPPPSLDSQQAQRLTAQALAQLAQMQPPIGRSPAQLPASLEAAMRSMDAFICNCAPGRHQLFTEHGSIDRIDGDDTI
jgi:hypothetical protein